MSWVHIHLEGYHEGITIINQYVRSNIISRTYFEIMIQLSKKKLAIQYKDPHVESWYRNDSVITRYNGMESGTSH